MVAPNRVVVPKINRKGCKCHFCTVTRLPNKWDWLTPTLRTYIDLRTVPEKYLVHIWMWMQGNSSTCKKAQYNGKYTELEQYDVVRDTLDTYRQERIDLNIVRKRYIAE